MVTVAISGSASGMGAATAARLRGGGHRVIGVDLRNTDVVADLATPDGRAEAVREVRSLSGGRLDGLVTFAGLMGLPSRSGSLLASVNYFGTVSLLDGLRDLLARGDSASAVAISSNSTTCQPGIPLDLVETCLQGDEAQARDIADRVGAMAAYPATKTAICRAVRRRAPSADWIGAGIRLNAIAPGFVVTPMTDEGRNDPQMGPFLDKFPVPTGPGQPEDIAALVMFLLSAESRFVCGSVILADGGTEALLRPDDWPVPWVIGDR